MMSASELHTPILTHSCNNDYNTNLYPDQNYWENRNSSLLQGIKLLGRNLQLLDKLFCVFLFVIFFVGTSIGVYLLVTEGYERRSAEVYNLTSREVWKARVPVTEMAKLEVPATKVLFLSSHSSGCDSKTQCVQLMQKLQLNHILRLKAPDILYNFAVSQDGALFEGRGWNFSVSFQNNTSDRTVNIAFLGNNLLKEPTTAQKKSIIFFLKESIRLGKLRQCFTVIVQDVQNIFTKFAKKMENQLNLCPQAAERNS